MSDLVMTHKADARAAARALRKVAHARGGDAAAQAHLLAHLRDRQPGTISAYMPIHSEIDPMPAMEDLHHAGWTVGLPVITARATPLSFRVWEPGIAMMEGDFGALIPRGDRQITPDVVIVPLLAFDATGARMGYGGGFYDRTLAGLRAAGRVEAIGFAYAGQVSQTPIPVEATDEPLDAVITEHGITRF